jgi:16S rRNA (adenine1518-N6/adenine1519-N6)-dimethyltransferase
MVKPKKYLGQHFLKDQNIAGKIADALVLPVSGTRNVLEIGPGTGVLTTWLMQKNQVNLKLIEIDNESVSYLQKNYPELRDKIFTGDFLELPIENYFEGNFAVIGNFPYHISSQIFFKILEAKDRGDEVVCMSQKEVAQRLPSGPGTKDYGILSVLLQAHYEIKYLFSVPPGVFNPPPKVNSGVIRLQRLENYQLDCDEKLFVKVVKQAFQMRRKTLRNALKGLNLPADFYQLELLDKRAEQLSVAQFVSLTKIIASSAGSRTV